MNILVQIFSFYDKLLLGLPTNIQFFVAIILLVLICWSFYSIFTHGHWIFIAIFVILFPGTWPAIKTIGTITWQVILFLLVRIQINL
ncbi:MAG: hypothetical protein Q7S80_01590 [bacterium]|nr:hypothetical protein [bacterium]